MQLVTVKGTAREYARSWYVKYPLDPYALGPYHYKQPQPATRAIEEALAQFGARPIEVWPNGGSTTMPAYEIELDEPAAQCWACGKVHADSALAAIRRSPNGARIARGETWGEDRPSGECPDCGALCYPIPD